MIGAYCISGRSRSAVVVNAIPPALSHTIAFLNNGGGSRKSNPVAVSPPRQAQASQGSP